MRVLWVIDSLGHGGAENLMPALLSHLKDDIVDPRVCVLNVRSGNPIAVELEGIGIPVDLIQVQNLRNVKSIWRLFSYIRKVRPDIIHTQLETSDIVGTICGRLQGIPGISTMHTLDVPVKRAKKYWRNFLRWTCLKHISRRVIVVSEFTRQHYLRLGFREEKLITLYNGIDPAIYLIKGNAHPSKAEIFGLADGCKVVTTVAVLREMKGIQYMLQALPGVLAKIPDLYYVIVGDGIYRNELENLSRTSGIADHVIFMGHRTDIPNILSASDLFVHPTLKDALPTALLEAMAARVPIVASQVGGIPEIVENGVSGLLVPPANLPSLIEACIRLLWDDKLAVRLTEAAGKTIEQRFNIYQQAKCLLNLYTQVVSCKGALRGW